MTANYRIEIANVSKRYDIYNKPLDRLKEILWGDRRSYHREYWALHDLSLRLPDRMTAVLGPNGSGKSTLLQLIAGVLQPTTGTIRINGRITAILELGAGFQPDYTGRENVLLNGMMLGISEEEMKTHLDEIAEFAEIGDFFDQPIKTYSSGMVIRLAFASCIGVNPDILLIDEAFAVGDKRFQKKCVRRMKELKNKGVTIIFVTHNVDTVRRHCDNAVLLNGGRLVAQGPIDDIVPLYDEIMANEDMFIPKVFTPVTVATPAAPAKPTTPV